MIILKALFITLTFLSLSVQAEDPYVAKSIEQYIESCQGAFDCLAKISPELSLLGRDVDKTLSFYKNLALKAADKEGKLTLETYRLQLAYITFKKVLKACELNKFELIEPFNIKSGRHDESSPILGIKSDSLKLYEEFAQKNPEFIRFGNSLYHQNSSCPGESSGNDLPSTSMTMLPANLKKIVDNSSQEDLNSYLEKYGLPPSQIVGESDFRAGVTRIYDTDNEWNNWTTHITIDPKGAYDERFDAYIPPQVISLHELCHVEHTLPGISEHETTNYSSSVHEIPCVIDQIILQDKLYKQAKGIPMSKVVSYQNPTQANKKPGLLNPGEVANKFRELKSKNSGDILKALMSAEGQTFVRSYFESSPECKKPISLDSDLNIDLLER